MAGTSDRYLEFVNSPVGAALASRVGLPRPQRLRRYRVDAPPLPSAALLGAVSGSVSPELAALVQRIGVEPATSAAEHSRWGALIFDATAAATPADLARFQAFFTPQLRRLAECARVLVLSRPPDGCEGTVDATRQAIEGIVRSLAKELRNGATANLLLVPQREYSDAGLESALRFFLSGRSAYVDGQPVRLDAVPVPEPSDWDRPLAGKTALVTGAARGIGAAVAEVLARDGAHVIAADLAQAGERLAALANRVGGTTLQLDIAAPDAPERMITHVQTHADGLDVLIHNAGITRDKLLANMKPEQWSAVLAVNLEAQLRINDALLASSALREQARVVSISSTTGLAGNRGQTNYAAAKAGIIGMVRACAPVFAAHGGSTINAVAPGFIDSEMTARMPLAMREVARRLCSLQQAGLPIDVAEAVAWLSSPGAGAVNGQVLRVCGQNLVGA